MSKVFRPYEPEQMLLMPACLQEWLSSDHLAYFISDVVDHLDLSAIMNHYEERGYPPYHPRMMVKVLIYAYCIGVPSSRKIERRLHEDVAFRVLAANNTPDFKTIKELLRRAQEIDEEEDKRYGTDCRGDELPRELAFRESRLKKIREARAALEAEAKRETEIARAAGKEHPGVPENKSQRNFTDPDSRIMPAPGGKDFIQAYNAQVAVDSAHQVIVACEVTDQPVDKRQAVPMMDQVKNNTGRLPREMSADAGYFSAKAVKEIIAQKVEAFIPPDKIRHTVFPPPASGHEPCRQNAQETANEAGEGTLCLTDEDGGASAGADKT
jgi:transposase